MFGADLVIGDRDGGDDGTLPGIEAVDFGDGDVEAIAEAVFEAFDDVAFVFEGVRVFDVDFEGEDTDDGHGDFRIAGIAKRSVGLGRRIAKRTGQID